MPDAVKYVVSSVLDPGTGAASSTSSGLPFSNVKDPLVRKVHRTTGKANEFWRFRASGGATGINAVGILNHSFSKSAIVLWQGNTTSNFASPALNTTLSVVTDSLGTVIPKIGYIYSSVQSYAHWRLVVRDSGNASSTLAIGRIFAGRYIQPTINIRDGFSQQIIDPSRRRMVAGRQGYANIRRKYTELSFGFTDVGEAQADQFVAMFNSVGKYAAFLFFLDPDSRPSHNMILTEFTTDVTKQQRILRQFSMPQITLSERN